MASIRKLLLSFFPLFFSSTAISDPLSIGGALSWEHSPYTKYKNHFSPIPHINYDNGTWYIEDATVGIYFYNQDHQNITLSLNYLANEFHSNNTRDNQLAQLSNRHPTLLAVLEYNIDTKIGSFSANIGHDTLNQSQSTLINFDYSVPLSKDNWVVLSKIGLSWADNKHNNYYYGISPGEASRSGLKYHNAHSSLTPYVEISSQYSLTKHISFYSGIKFERLTGDAANSPMIARKTIPTFYAGLIYGF